MVKGKWKIKYQQ